MIFLFVCCYTRYFFIIPVVKEKIEVKLASAIPIGDPTTLTEEIIQTLPLVALKTIKFYPCNQKQQHIYYFFTA